MPQLADRTPIEQLLGTLSSEGVNDPTQLLAILGEQPGAAPPRKRTAAEAERHQLIEWALQSPSHFAIALGFDVFPQQLTTQDAVLNNTRIAIRGCHSSGKTFFLAMMAVWWVLKYEYALVLTTAPTFEQVTKIMWGEIRRIAQKARDVLGIKMKMPDKSQWQLGPGRELLGRSTSRAVNFQGYHSENCLLIIDEAPGLIEDLWGAIDGITASGNIRIVMLGNPTISSGMFFEASKYRAGWKAISYSALRDNPNVAGLAVSEWPEGEEYPPGCGIEEIGRLATLMAMDEDDPELDADATNHMAKRRWIREKWLDWGLRGDPQWYSRVLGEFPPEDEQSLISRRSLDAARVPAQVGIEDCDEIEWGIDVAGEGQNDTVVVARQGDDLLGLWPVKESDARRSVLNIIQPYLNQTAVVRVDSAGLGDYFTKYLGDELGQIGLPVDLIGVNVGRAASDNSQWLNLRMELSWKLKRRFDRGQMRGITDEKLRRELLSLRWWTNERGVRQMEPKKDAKERGVPSPDRADALMLAFSGLNLQDAIADTTITYEPDDFQISPY